MAYSRAFTDVFFMQRDPDLANGATEALATHHTNGLLRGQPLDAVVDRYVDPQPVSGQSFSVEQLSLVNRINLISGDESAFIRSLVAALLLVAEDHRQGELDPILSPSLIWQRVDDEAWLVSQLARIKADGTTVAEIDEMISIILADL